MNYAIEFNHISAAYRGHIALRNLSFNVPSGRIIGIAGQNGSGKTTVLRVIQGLVPITSGVARVFGIDLIPSNFRRIRTETSCVFQLLEVDPRMPVLAREAVMMGRYGKMSPFQHPSGKDFDCVRRAMDQADALHLAERPFGQLSGGERQRINLARALAQEPKLLLLDEPTTFLDRDSRLRIAETIKAVHERYSLTTVIVSHESRVLNELCDDIIHIENGSCMMNQPVTGETYD